MIQINFYEQNYFLDEDNEEGILQENFSILHLKEKMIRKIGNQIITHSYRFTPSLLLVDYQGEILSDEIILSKIYNVSSSSSSSFACIHLSIHLKNETIGGKGGFGAQLRSLAKQKVGKQTTNFGACRDLSGRRLRHLNDELILKKWKDAKEKGIPFDPEQETSTGIDLWFLSAPKWADGVKVDRRKRFMKSRMKTSLCIDWLRARERGSPPPTAPNDWGCPRGAFCEFAHGEEELKGFEKEKLENEEHQKYQEEKQRKKDLYMKPLQSIKSDDEISALVLEGLQAAKKAKISKSKSIVTTAISSSSSKSIEENCSSSHATSRNQNYQGPIQLLSGNVVAENISGVPMITGDSKFATITVPNSNSHSVGNWFYEVELLSDGLMQIGWINDQFRSNSEDGMGVGDDQHSWGYDGFRRKLFHNGNEIDVEYYRKSEEKGKEKKDGEGMEESNDNHVWKEEDIVGCLLSIEECKGDVDQKKIVISYYLNGIRLTADFEFFVANDRAIFFPAVSIEDQESIRLNLGVEAFKFPPSVSFTSCL